MNDPYANYPVPETPRGCICKHPAWLAGGPRRCIYCGGIVYEDQARKVTQA